MKNKYMFLYVLIGLLAFDFIMFLMWALSGQYPLDSFYFGVITRTILIALF